MLLQKQTGEVVASVSIVPCIYSLIGAYPGVLQLSAAHEGINQVLVKYVVSSLCKIKKKQQKKNMLIHTSMFSVIVTSSHAQVEDSSFICRIHKCLG